jgi:RNase P/RNase MRP subunit POP5
MEDKNEMTLLPTSVKSISGLASDEIKKAIQNSVLENFGQFGLSTVQMSLQVKYWNDGTNTCIIRIARDYITVLLGSLAFVRKIRGFSCTWQTLHVAGNYHSLSQQTQRLSY